MNESRENDLLKILTRLNHHNLVICLWRVRCIYLLQKIGLK